DRRRELVPRHAPRGRVGHRQPGPPLTGSRHHRAVGQSGGASLGHGRGARRPTTSPGSAAALAWRCTTFHSPSSRRKIVVTRSTYGLGSAPLTDAVVCSSATVWARSPEASAATIWFWYDRQPESCCPSVSKIDPISPHPRPDIAAPNSVSGSARAPNAPPRPAAPLVRG